MPTPAPRRAKRPPTSDDRPWRPGPLSLAIAIATIASVGALVYSGTGVGIVWYRLLTGGALTAVWVCSGAGLGGLLLRLPALRPPPTTDAAPNRMLNWVTAAALGLGLIGLAALALGLVGWLHFATAVQLLGVGLACGAAVLFLPKLDRGDSPPAEGNSHSRWGWLWLAAAPFLAVSLVGTTVPPGFLWSPEEPHGYDVAEYHLQVPREWYDAGRIVPLKHNVFGYFPMGVEVHYLLAMHLQGGPWEGMYLAQMMHLAMVVLAALAVWGVAIDVAPGRRSAVLAAVAAATVPWLAQLGAVAYTEGGFLLFGTLALGWALRAVRQAAPAERIRHFAIGGAMAGFACGTKLTAVPEILIGLPAACAAAVAFAGRTERLAKIRSIFGGCVAYGVVGLLLFAPWLARNVAWTGNPVFPEAAKVLGKAHWNDVQVERWHRANHEPGMDIHGPAGTLWAVWDQVLGSWQFGFLFPPLVLVALLTLAAGAGTAWRRPAVFAPAAMLGGLSVFWIGFTHLQGRFYLLAVPLGAVLLAQVDWGSRLPWVAGLVLAAAAVGWFGLHRRIVAAVQGTPDKPGGLADALGRTPLGWVTPAALDPLLAGGDARQTSADTEIVLIGEARAFYYQVPMSRLRYRTVFDVATQPVPAAGGEALANAWQDKAADAPRSPHEWLVISGPELQRLSRTYFDIPAPPPSWMRGQESLVVRPGESLPR